MTTAMDSMMSLHEAFLQVENSHKDSAAVSAIKKWTDDLSKLLERGASMSSADKRAMIMSYSTWVRSYGGFYKTVLNNNPALAEVFQAVEKALNIEVKIVKESLTVSENDMEDVGSQSDVDFVLTLKEALQKIPSTTLKQRFAYQFKRWERTTPVEMQRLERTAPTIYALVREIVAECDVSDNDPTEHDYENADKDSEHLDAETGEIKQ